MRRRKVYTHSRDPITGKRVLTHRLLAKQVLGRPLLPREVVHHRDGDSSNNDLANLIVLPSQRVHAHAEYHYRRNRSGMPSLFPEYFQVIPDTPQGTLFDHILLWQGQEPPLTVRAIPEAEVAEEMPLLLPEIAAATSALGFELVVNEPDMPKALTLKKILENFQIVQGENCKPLLPSGISELTEQPAQSQ